MFKPRILAFIVATTIHSHSLAAQSATYPVLEERRWTMSTHAVMRDGQVFNTPESIIPCLLPTRDMQRDVDQLMKKGVTVEVTSVSERVMRSTLTWPDGKGRITVTLTTPDAHSYTSFVETETGTNEMKGRWLGPCAPADKKRPPGNE